MKKSSASKVGKNTEIRQLTQFYGLFYNDWGVYLKFFELLLYCRVN